jgi:hypothetical protein
MLCNCTIHVDHKYMTHNSTTHAHDPQLAGCLSSVQCDLLCYLPHDTFSWYVFN